MNPRQEAYDRAITIFSPEGNLYQVEYASKLIARAAPGLGIKYKGGILLGGVKFLPTKLMVPQSLEKIFKVDDNIYAVSSGLAGDARFLIDIARELAVYNWQVYDEPIQISYLVKRISAIMHEFTQSGGVRPFGVSLIFGGYESSESTFKLFEAELTGAYAEYKAIAIGSNADKVMDLLEKKYNDNLSKKEALSLLREMAITATNKEILKNRKAYLQIVDIQKSGTKISEEILNGGENGNDGK